MATTTKAQRLAHYDAQLKALEAMADKAHYHIDSDPEYIALTALVVDWDMGERRFCPSLKLEIFNLHRSISQRIEACYCFSHGVAWGENLTTM